MLEELTALKKQQLLCLTELSGLTEELGQAVDRRDQVAVKMVLSMRQEPLQKLQETEEVIRAKLLQAPQEDAIRLTELLNGAQGESEREEALCRQVAQTGRLLQKVAGMDRQISLRMGGRGSFYRKYREENGK